MLTYLSVDETLIMWCVVSGVIGFWIGVIVNGFKKHEDPRVDTIVYASPMDGGPLFDLRGGIVGGAEAMGGGG